MNCNKELNLSHPKSKVLLWAILAIFSIVFTFTACNNENDCDCEPAEEYPSLKVVDQLTFDAYSIIKVSLVGYEFNSLNIQPSGGSQTFVLDKGMSGGYNDINVTVTYKGYIEYSTSIKVNFNKGKTTTITLKGCVSAEGCPGIYLEYIP